MEQESGKHVTPGRALHWMTVFMKDLAGAVVDGERWVGGRNILTTFTGNGTINSHKGKRRGNLSKCPPNNDGTLESLHVSIAVCVYAALRLTGYLNRETGIASESGRERKTSM